MNTKKRKISMTSWMHYIKLGYRSALFLVVAAMYIVHRINGIDTIFNSFQDVPIIMIIVWLVFAVEMVARFLPFKIESMGCQKQFLRNYKPVESEEKVEPIKQKWQATFLVAFLWLLLNAVIALLYFLKVIDQGILILVSLAYSVCDMICILFFCPFHTLIMKNKCCTTCRIYNWDYAMMFTPLILIPNVFTWSIVLLSLILLAKWEIFYKLYPERFTENTNQSLKCINCKEKLCSHKKSLQKYLLKQWKHLKVRFEFLEKSNDNKQK